MYKPKGHNSLSLYLIVDDAQVTLDFIKAVFDAEPDLLHRGEDGSIAHAEIRIDDTVLMVGQFKDSGSVAHIHVYVPDVRHSFELARTAGGKAVQEPVQKDDPDLRGGSWMGQVQRGGSLPGRNEHLRTVSQPFKGRRTIPNSGHRPMNRMARRLVFRSHQGGRCHRRSGQMDERAVLTSGSAQCGQRRNPDDNLGKMSSAERVTH